MTSIRTVRIILPIALSLTLGCTKERTNSEQAAAQVDKIEFDLSVFNEDGLYGPVDGLRAMSYEFCIPADSIAMNEVKAIDATVELYVSSPGRSECSAEQVLCIGHTHQPQFRSVLLKLAELPYIERIRTSHFE